MIGTVQMVFGFTSQGFVPIPPNADLEFIKAELLQLGDQNATQETSLLYMTL
jgi:hypothetical protein